ncbi:hypothetical protein [Micromonospora zamorensis]|uniref:hypothetical protein n=1 Tax=Micromonospora zamorensis TaxID=709883 RepID=UPI003411DC2E
MRIVLQTGAQKSVFRKPSVAASLVLSTVSVVAAVVTFQAVGMADDGVPPEKAAVLAAPPGSGNDVDDSTGSAAFPIVSPSPDTAPAAFVGEIPHVKNAAVAGMTRFNEMQILPVGQSERVAVATQINADIQSALVRGPDAFVNEASPDGSRPDGSQAPQFRKDLVGVLTPSFAMSEGSEVATQLLHDAQNVNTPSLTSTRFILVQWQGVTVTTRFSAKAVLLGTYETCFAGGEFQEPTCQTDPTQQWQLDMMKSVSDNKWRVASRDGQAVDDVFSDLPTAVEPGPSPS